MAGDADSMAAAHRCRSLFTGWETDAVEILSVTSREDTLHLDHLERIGGATGILLLGKNPVRMATYLGGAPLAQVIRRANARGPSAGTERHPPGCSAVPVKALT